MNFRHWKVVGLTSLFTCLLWSATLPALSNPAGHPVPSWVREGVVYELFPRDFSPEGNFNRITARLDELKDLGVNIVWLMPIHPLGEKMRKGTLGSPYAVKDYYGINPDYGTADDLKHLVKEAHQRGMKVILDVVLNHTAWDNVLMAHPDFYKQDASGKIIPPVKEWTDVAGLNYANPKLCEYMITMLKHWIDPAGFDLDGFRCDVAHMVPVAFWESARAALIQTKPDIMMLAEASSPELMVKAFDLDYSWPLHSTLNNVLLHGAPASDLKKSWEESMRQFPEGALHLRMSDNHDEPRAVARFSINGALACSALMFCLDGVPLIYNGMEVGDATESGDPALFEKLPIFWHPKDRPNVRSVYQGLIRLRKDNPAFTSGPVNWVGNSDEADVVSFTRTDAKNEFLVVVNFSNRPLTASVRTSHESDFQPVPLSGMPACSAAGFPTLHLNGFEWRVYHRAL